MINPDGWAPNQTEVFRLTHTRQDGQPLDSTSKAVTVCLILIKLFFSM